jgi:hypothetical protein
MTNEKKCPKCEADRIANNTKKRVDKAANVLVNKEKKHSEAVWKWLNTNHSKNCKKVRK